MAKNPPQELSGKTGEPERLFLIATADSNLYLHKGLQGGVPFVDLFFAFFRKGFTKKATVLKKVKLFEFVTVCFFLVFLEHIQSGDGRSLLVLSWFSGSILNLK